MFSWKPTASSVDLFLLKPNLLSKILLLTSKKLTRRRFRIFSRILDRVESAEIGLLLLTSSQYLLLRPVHSLYSTHCTIAFLRALGNVPDVIVILQIIVIIAISLGVAHFKSLDCTLRRLLNTSPNSSSVTSSKAIVFKGVV